jgi:CheY-like chemotaxis protein
MEGDQMKTKQNTRLQNENWRPRREAHLRVQSALGLHILVVGDDPETIDLAFRFRLDRHSVRVVRDGPSALRIARAHAPDVVMLDADRLGIGGWQMAQQLWAQQTPRKPLMIAVAGCGQEVESHPSQEAGIHLHLVKPVDADFLRKLLRRFQDIVLPGDSSYGRDTQRWSESV